MPVRLCQEKRNQNIDFTFQKYSADTKLIITLRHQENFPLKKFVQCTLNKGLEKALCCETRYARFATKKILEFFYGKKN